MKHLFNIILIPCLLSPLLGYADAVSQMNGKVSVQGGNVNGDSSENLEGSFTTPVSKNHGLQLDGIVGDVSRDQLHGTGLHFFRRDPSNALIGLTASHVELAEEEINRYGFEAEKYRGDFTVGLDVGYQEGDAIDHDSFSSLEGKYYVTDNIMIGVGAAQEDSQDTGTVKFEYLFVNNLSFYGSVVAGEGDYDSALFGLRYFFGPTNKSLKLRHREDDPESDLPTMAGFIKANGAVDEEEITCPPGYMLSGSSCIPIPD